MESTVKYTMVYEEYTECDIFTNKVHNLFSVDK